MTPSVEKLHGLLERLDRLLNQSESPVAAGLRPGLAAREIEERMRPVELALPLEAQVWWQWHDGVDHVAPGWWVPLHEQIGDSNLALLQLSEAVDKYWDYRRLAVRAEPDSPERLFRRSWFPILRFDGHPAVIQCGSSADVSGPLRLIEWQDELFDEVRAPSLTALVAVWVELLETGVWKWTGDGWRSSLPHTHPKMRLAQLAPGGM